MPPTFPDPESFTYRIRSTYVATEPRDESDTGSISDYEIFKSRRTNGGEKVIGEIRMKSFTYEDANDTFASKDSPPASIRSFGSAHSSTFDMINAFEITNVDTPKIHLTNQKKPSLSSKLKSMLGISTKEKQCKPQYKPYKSQCKPFKPHKDRKQYVQKGSYTPSTNSTVSAQRGSNYAPSTNSTVSAPTLDLGSRLSRYSTQNTRVFTDSIFGFSSTPSIRSVSTLRNYYKETGKK